MAIDEIFPPYTGDTPDRSMEPSVFDTAVKYLLDYLVQFIPIINTWRTEANALGVEINDNAIAASNSADEAEADAIIATSVANNKGAWSNLTGALNIPATVNHSNITWALNVNLADVTASEPTALNTDWTAVSGFTKEDMTKAIGNINNPLLDLPLNNSLAMKQGVGSVTFSRSTTATYIDRYGVLQSAAIDEPRFEKNGLLIEGASTNDCLNSEDLNNATYTKASGMAVSTDTIVAPDGNTTMDTLTSDGISASNLQFRETSPTLDKYTLSCYVKEDSSDVISLVMYNTTEGFNSVTFTFSTETFSVNANLITKIIEKTSDGSYRLSISMAVANSDTFVEARVYPQVAAGTAVESVYSWGWQLEKLPFASSYMPTTTTAVTRNADVCLVDYKNTGLGNTFTAIGTFDTLGHLTDNQFLYQINGLTSISTFVVDSSIDGVFISSGSGTTLGGSGLLHNTQYKMARVIDVELASSKVYQDGLIVSSDPSGLTEQSSTPSLIVLGANGGQALQLYGHIRDFRIYNFALTATEARLA